MFVHAAFVCVRQDEANQLIVCDESECVRCTGLGVDDRSI